MAELVTNASLQAVCGFGDVGSFSGEREDACPGWRTVVTQPLSTEGSVL